MCELDAAVWDSLCASSYPFIKHAFLSALEESGSVSESAGWRPCHLLGYRNGLLVAGLPLYLKSHSYGEYVFDWAWAEAYQRYGLPYYPKLLTAIPFTPCWGPRLLLSPSLTPVEKASVEQELIQQLQHWVDKESASGWHGLFVTEDERRVLSESGFAERIGTQFHWYNRGYANWDDFAAQLSSRKRKLLNKERRQVIEQGFEFTQKTGQELTEADWELFYRFYRNTYYKRSGHKGYLTREFFLSLHQKFKAHTLMVLATRSGKTLAASLYFYDDDTLYGRYWGCEEEFPLLHFETCYYQGIDFAIARGLKRFDGGAQGEHKIQRGFEPISTYSLHWLREPGFHNAVVDFVQREAESVAEYQAAAMQHLPYKQNDNNEPR